MDAAIRKAMHEARAGRQLPAPDERRRLRVSGGIPQRAIAEAIGVRRDAVSRYEHGTRTPRGDVLLRYLRVLDAIARELNEHDPDGGPGRAVTTDVGDRRVEP